MLMTDKDGREFKVFCNRCNAELLEVRRCSFCGDVEYRIVYLEAVNDAKD